MEKRITSSEAVRRFSDVINRVRYNGDEFVVERNGEPVCRIVSVKRGVTAKEFFERMKRLPKVDPGFWDDVEWARKNQPPLPEKSSW